MRIDGLVASYGVGSVTNPVLLGTLVGGPGSLEAGRTPWREGSTPSGEL